MKETHTVIARTGGEAARTKQSKNPEIATPRFARFATAFLFCAVFSFFIKTPVSFSEEMVQRLDGKVASTSEEQRLLVVDFEHPATGEQHQKEFVVREGAGFKDFKKLSQLKKGDLVSLDYVDSMPMDTAIYVMHIPLEKTYFTPTEIAQALVQIKTNPKR